ncbi:DUF2958 domain-containing protein [Sphingopyxis fribergensis]
MAQMIANGLQSSAGADRETSPVVRLFLPDGHAVWLLSEIDPGDSDRAFGLCDLGLGFPELGFVRLRELADLRGPLGLGVECDLAFVPRMSLAAYARLADQHGHIVT